MVEVQFMNCQILAMLRRAQKNNMKVERLLLKFNSQLYTLS